MHSTSSRQDFFKLHEIEVTIKKVPFNLSKPFPLTALINKYFCSSCSGVLITSEWESETTEEFITKGPISKVLGKYKKYKMVQDFSKDFKGII